MRPIEHLRYFSDDRCSRGVGKLGELLEMLVQQMPCARSLYRSADQYCPLSGRTEIDRVL
jgi:hypothetical protein